MKYSFKKGLVKGAVSLLSIVGAFVAFTAFSDMTLWGLLETYLKPMLGAVTVGGALTMLQNYLKIKAKKK